MIGPARDIVKGAYEAAFDETLWSDWAWNAAEALGGSCGTFYVVERTGAIRHMSIRHSDEKATERYLDEEMFRFDPQIAFAAALRSPAVYTDIDHVDADDPSASEYFRWQASNGNLRHYLTAAVPFGDRLAGLSVHRGLADGETPSETRLVLQQLLPHLVRSIELGFSHAEKMSNAYWDGLMTQRSEPCALVGKDGRILRMTASLASLLAQNDGLFVKAGRLTSGGGTADKRLDEVIGCLGRNRASSACRIPRPSGKPMYVVTGFTLPQSSDVFASVKATALITVVDPAATPATEENLWRAAYRLTVREAQFVTLLMHGHSLDYAAARMQITRSTARVYLRNVFYKTETNRQADLIKTLWRLRAGLL